MTFETQTILWAFLAAFLAASTNVTLARVLAQVGSFTLAQIANIGNAVFLGIYGLWIFDISIFRWEAFAWFGVLGVTNFCMNRWVFYNGMKAMGPSRHVTITSMVPLPTLLVAVLVLGERPGPLVLLGTALVVAGVVTACYSPSKGRWFQAGIGWSLTSMLVFAGGGYMRNRGMNIMSESALLTAWAALVAVPTGEMFRTVFPKRILSWERVGWSLVPLIVLGIIFNSVHQVVMNISLKGQISLAIPIMSSTPVFVMILSSIFLRDLERLNARVVVGILITFMGMAAIGFGRYG
ncbi:MAG: DMT family transporter [Nitrospinota bacterium]